MEASAMFHQAFASSARPPTAAARAAARAPAGVSQDHVAVLLVCCCSTWQHSVKWRAWRVWTSKPRRSVPLLEPDFIVEIVGEARLLRRLRLTKLIKLLLR